MSDDEIEKKAQELAEEVAGWSRNKLANQMLLVDPEYKKKHLEGMAKLSKTPEWRECMATAGKKRANSPAWQKNHLAMVQRKRSRPVVREEDSTIFRGASVVNRANKGNSVAAAVSGRRSNVAYGHHWRYATPEEVAWFWAERERTGTDGPFQLPDNA